MTVDAETSVRESVTVPLPAERAFALFTERMHEWWPASQISARFTYDPDLETEGEVTFTEEPPGTTRVDLEHRHLDRFGDAAAAIRDVFRSPGGWPGILAGYAAHVGS